ncbi:MAG: pyrroline-5-carboxylate reductase [Betaproteobacteria bacterium]|nr:pyrroline-5-carboxylate reductase [Betaproteobacteria bacterium]
MNITFIGGGNMASAIIGGLLKKRWPARAIKVVEVVAPARARLESEFKVKTYPAITSEAVKSDCIVLAIKPQQMHEVTVQLGPYLSSRQIVLSIAAGIRLNDLARWLGNRDYILVRAMPNTPALIGAGITGLAFYSFPPKPTLATEKRKTIETIMSAVGAVFWVRGEEDMDAVTAVSGSGPAYVFYFIEALEQAAKELGLSPETAQKLALETFSGAARLALMSKDPVTALRERVTSKGGTTERALKSMETDRVKEAIVRAARAAAERSRELGDEFGKD